MEYSQEKANKITEEGRKIIIETAKRIAKEFEERAKIKNNENRN